MACWQRHADFETFAGCLSRIAEQLVLCIALDRTTVTVGVVIGALAHLTMPAISSLISKNSEQYEQARALLSPLASLDSCITSAAELPVARAVALRASPEAGLLHCFSLLH